MYGVAHSVCLCFVAVVNILHILSEIKDMLYFVVFYFCQPSSDRSKIDKRLSCVDADRAAINKVLLSLS